MCRGECVTQSVVSMLMSVMTEWWPNITAWHCRENPDMCMCVCMYCVYAIVLFSCVSVCLAGWLTTVCACCLCLPACLPARPRPSVCLSVFSLPICLSLYFIPISVCVWLVMLLVCAGELRNLGAHSMKLQAVVLDNEKQPSSLRLPSMTVNFTVTGQFSKIQVSLCTSQ